jgi:DNA-binding NtrC family response regulator
VRTAIAAPSCGVTQKLLRTSIGPQGNFFYASRINVYYESVTNQKWLISWIGKTDHLAAEGDLGTDVGPIATALREGQRFERIYLLTSYDFERSRKYCEWLEDTSGYPGASVDLYKVDLQSPIDYASIYSEVSTNLKAAGLPRNQVDLTFHLSPGTPAMAAIWIMLAKTRFPARLIQTSRENGLEHVDFPFDLASDFLPEYLQRTGDRINRLTDGPAGESVHFSKILHRSAVMRDLVGHAQRVAAYDVPVLILGETGTGKELFAEAIHSASTRADKPFIAVNCGAISPELASSELFGHKKGAFTGANSDRIGYFQAADGGTLFLDEVGDLPLESQVRLLRALQAKEVTPLGASKPAKVNVRVVAATHRNLAADVRSGQFREDLFHRLAVGILKLPPLRERAEDVEMLIDAFLNQINADSRGKPEAQDKFLSVNAKNLLISYEWPGNVRELYHTILRASIWSSGNEIHHQDVQSSLLDIHKRSENLLELSFTQGFDLQGLLDNISRTYIQRALRNSGDRKSAAAKLLGFANYQTLGNWMTRLGIETTESNDE